MAAGVLISNGDCSYDGGRTWQRCRPQDLKATVNLYNNLTQNENQMEECTTCGGGSGGGSSINTPSTLNNYNPSFNNNNNNYNPNNMNGNNNYVAGWRGCTPPQPIILTATVGAGVTTLFTNDSTGLYVAYNSTVGFQLFDVAGNATLVNLNEWLKTGWFYVNSFSLQSSQTATLQNSLVLVNTQMDGSEKPQLVSSAMNVSNMQQNPNLLNVCCGFILTNTTALRLPITAVGETVVLSLSIGACGYYGQLGDFLASNPLITCGSGICNIPALR